jgi:hypothetical protein
MRVFKNRAALAIAASIGVIVVLAAASLAIVNLRGGSHDSGDVGDSASSYPQSKRQLTSGDPLLAQVQSLAEVQEIAAKVGRQVDWGQAYVTKAPEVPVDVVTAPIYGEVYSRFLVVYLSDQKEGPAVFQMELKPPSEAAGSDAAATADAAAYGEITFYNSKDEVVASSEDGEQAAASTDSGNTPPDAYVSAEVPGAAQGVMVAPAWEDWRCFGNCLRTMWSRFPWGLRWACNSWCSSCMWTNPYACGACAACQGVYATTCLRSCWR